MNTSRSKIRAEWLAVIGVGLGLVVAVLVDQMVGRGMTDRPVLIAGVTAIVALLWLALVRAIQGTTPAQARAPKRSQP